MDNKVENYYNKISKKCKVSNKKKFDIVCSFEVIEHLFSVKNYFKKLKKLIKPNGILIVTCPNGNGFDVRFLLKESKKYSNRIRCSSGLDSRMVLLQQSIYACSRRQSEFSFILNPKIL